MVKLGTKVEECILSMVRCCPQEAEQKRLEVEMQKRRERIEQWRAARKPKQEDVQVVQAAPASRKWTLEDEEDEDADNDVAATQNGENEAVDPLDAYMQVRTAAVLVIAVSLNTDR